MEFLEQVVDIEPAFVPGLWTLAWSIHDLSLMTNNAVDTKYAVNTRIRSLVDRMVELAPDSSYTNDWLSYLAELDGEDLQTQVMYRERAVAGATNTDIYQQLTFAAEIFDLVGRTDEALATMKYVVARDPACSTCVYRAARMLRNQGRYPEAAEMLDTIRRKYNASPSINWSLGVVWLVLGEPERALEYFDQTIFTAGDLGRILALHDLGRLDEFEAEFQRFRADANNRDDPEPIARVYAWTGQNDLAFEYLERMVDEKGSSSAANVDTDLYEPIKSDPRWTAFLEQNGVRQKYLSHIKFDPPLPPEVVAEIERLRTERE